MVFLECLALRLQIGSELLTLGVDESCQGGQGRLPVGSLRVSALVISLSRMLLCLKAAVEDSDMLLQSLENCAGLRMCLDDGLLHVCKRWYDCGELGQRLDM